jgi:hypothetical protein
MSKKKELLQHSLVIYSRKGKQELAVGFLFYDGIRIGSSCRKNVGFMYVNIKRRLRLEVSP